MRDPTDDERNWVNGVYVNPDDPRVWVPTPNRMRWTVNMGHPDGKRTLAFTFILCILAFLAIGASVSLYALSAR